MTKCELEIILEKSTSKKPFVSARFGDGWKKYAKENLSKSEIIDLALLNGRRSVIMEKMLINEPVGGRM